MTYVYHCEACAFTFDVIKSVKDIDVNETCKKCGDFAVRQFVPHRTYLNKTSVEHAEYNPGLGCIVRNSQHRKEICKARGLEEIGNEKPETIHKHYDNARTEKLEKAWSEVDKGWVGNGDVGA